MKFDRYKFFDSVRKNLFAGKMTDAQVNGMEYKLQQWEQKPYSDDLRHLAYALATSYHETGTRMEPVREGFCETDQEARAYVKKHGYNYAEVDPVTGQVYYGRGDIQTTWAANYKKAGQALGYGDALYFNPEKMLEVKISADALYLGMTEGWYRASSDGRRQTLDRYFSVSNNVDDPYGAREIVNGDKSKVPSWSNGASIGNLIRVYHNRFLEALRASLSESEPEATPTPTPEPKPPQEAPSPGKEGSTEDEAVVNITVDIYRPKGVKVNVIVVDPGPED